jgi:hypothetical protein
LLEALFIFSVQRSASVALGGKSGFKIITAKASSYDSKRSLVLALEKEYKDRVSKLNAYGSKRS